MKKYYGIDTNFKEIWWATISMSFCSFFLENPVDESVLRVNYQFCFWKTKYPISRWVDKYRGVLRKLEFYLRNYSTTANYLCARNENNGHSRQYVFHEAVLGKIWLFVITRIDRDKATKENSKIYHFIK